MSSLQEDLDDLMWPVRFKFDRKMSRAEYYDLVDWCNDRFGMNGWFHESNGYMWLKKEQYQTMFMLKWA